MSATSTNKAGTQDTSTGTSVFTQVPFDAINEPGCYVCNWSGHLLRVPDDGVAAGRSPVINIVATQRLYVTKLSDNPYIPVTKAKMLASNADLNICF